MIGLEWKDEAFLSGLGRLSMAMSDMSPVMQDIGEYLIKSTKDRFPKGEAPDGSKWAPKKQSTMDAYAARKDRVDARPLFGPTGLLSQQIAYDAAPDGVEWGSNRIYAAVMQFGAAKGAFGTTSRGASIPWGTIPARPFLGISDEDETQLVAILSDYLQGAADGAA